MNYGWILAIFAGALVLASDFYSLDDEDLPLMKAKPSPVQISPPKSIEETQTSSGSVDQSAPTDLFFEDLSGSTVSGIPRVIRGDPETEVFLKGVNGGFVIPKDSRHNLFFEQFNQAMKAERELSFKYDPISRRVLHVNGVGGVKSKPKKEGAK